MRVFGTSIAQKREGRSLISETVFNIKVSTHTGDVVVNLDVRRYIPNGDSAVMLSMTATPEDLQELAIKLMEASFYAAEQKDELRRAKEQLLNTFRLKA